MVSRDGRMVGLKTEVKFFRFCLRNMLQIIDEEQTKKRM